MAATGTFIRGFAFLALGIAAQLAARADEAQPKLGPRATAVLAATEHLRRSPSPDYWAMSPFYVPQTTSSDCTVATVVIAINMLRGLPKLADDPIVTGESLLRDVGVEEWTRYTRDQGSGVTFAEFDRYVRASVAKLAPAGSTVATVKPVAADARALATFRAALRANEASARNVMLVAFNQGVVTGTWDGPHASPIGAYDAKRDRVLIMDVDREWYVPYWTSTATLLAAMVKPAPPEMRRLAGETGGYIVITRP